MYFPFFQREHKVHHHILSAGFFALLSIHAYLGVDALLAGPTVMEKSGKLAALERQTPSYKELAREARKLIISSRKKGKVLKLTEAMNIVNNGVYNRNGRLASVGGTTRTPKIGENAMTFSSAPSQNATETELYGTRVAAGGKRKKSTQTTTTSSTTTSPTSSTSTTTTTTTTTPTFNSAPSGGGSSSPSTSTTTTTTPTSISTGSSSSGSTSPTTSTSSTGSTTNSGSTNVSSTGTTSSGTTQTSTSSGTTTTLSGSTTNTGSTNTGTTSSGTTVTPPPAPTTSTAISITNTENPHLKKLSDYQKIAGGFVGDHLMVFLNMPESAASIEGASYYIANTANEFAKFGVTPIFVIEPFGDNGQLDLGRIKNGDYVAKLDSLFALLKGPRGLTEDKLGILVPYPEINTPAFNRANFVPTDLPILVNQYFDVVRKYYPNAKGGLLLDGKSYDIGKTWGQGEYKSYAPYVTGIKSGYISTFGVQGFPWVSADGTIKSYDPNVFLPISLAKESAGILSISKIWFNTGTMKRSYPSNPVYTSPEDRQIMMNGIVNQGKTLTNQGYSVLIHIFAENKFSLGEGIDWSFLENANDGILGQHEAVFANFIQGLQNTGIQVGLYDM